MAEFRTRIYGLSITVDKVGGGTPGRAYGGDWTVTVKNGSEFIYDGATLTHELPHTHAEVAEAAADFACEEIDGL